MSSLLPAGRFLATVVRRKTIPKEQGSGVEYTFRIAQGEYEGELVSMRLWSPGRIERAESLTPRGSIEVVVGHREGGGGKRFATVHDFKKIDEPTAADAVRGRDDSTSRSIVNGIEVAPGMFRPHRLMSRVDREDALWWTDGEEPEESPPISYPLLEDCTVEKVTAAATGADDQPLASVEDAPDFSEADYDDEEHRWVITRTGGDRPVATRLVDDETPPPLPVASEAAGRPLWVSLFRYLADLPSFMAAHRQSVKKYSGPAWSGALPVRFVAENGLADVIERARLVATTCVRLGVPREQVVAINGWNQGLTLFIPSCVANVVAQVGFERVAGHFAQALTDLACAHTFDVEMEDRYGVQLPKDRSLHARIDRQLYGPVAIHPAINSPDERGRLFAVPLSYDELVSLPAADIEKLVVSPRPVPRPPWRANEVDTLVELWEYAVEAEKLRSKRFAWLMSGRKFVHADSFDFMHHGSEMESAPKRLFRAAVNLLRLGCSRDAVIALLHPAAHLSGLGQREVEWGVECAARSLVPEGFYMDDDE
jgi:hypothetical protein